MKPTKGLTLPTLGRIVDLFRPLTSARHSSFCISALLDGSQSVPGRLTWVSAVITYCCWEGNGLQVQGLFEENLAYGVSDIQFHFVNNL